MPRDYVAELTAVRNAMNAAMESGGLVNIRIGDQSYTLSYKGLQDREAYLVSLIRIRSGGGRSIIGQPT